MWNREIRCSDEWEDTDETFDQRREEQRTSIHPTVVNLVARFPSDFVGHVSSRNSSDILDTIIDVSNGEEFTLDTIMDVFPQITGHFEEKKIHLMKIWLDENFSTERRSTSSTRTTNLSSLGDHISHWSRIRRLTSISEGFFSSDSIRHRICSLTNEQFSRRKTIIRGEQRWIQFQRSIQFIENDQQFLCISSGIGTRTRTTKVVIPFKDEAKKTRHSQHLCTSQRSDHWNGPNSNPIFQLWREISEEWKLPIRHISNHRNEFDFFRSFSKCWRISIWHHWELNRCLGRFWSKDRLFYLNSRDEIEELWWCPNDISVSSDFDSNRIVEFAQSFHRSNSSIWNRSADTSPTRNFLFAELCRFPPSLVRFIGKKRIEPGIWQRHISHHRFHWIDWHVCLWISIVSLFDGLDALRFVMRNIFQIGLDNRREREEILLNRIVCHFECLAKSELFQSSLFNQISTRRVFPLVMNFDLFKLTFSIRRTAKSLKLSGAFPTRAKEIWDWSRQQSIDSINCFIFEIHRGKLWNISSKTVV